MSASAANSGAAPADQHHGSVSLGRAFALVAAFSVVEVVGGLWSNSLTLLADAGHMVLDAGALGMAWCALRISQRPPSAGMTYGYGRAQVLAAFVNGLMLAALAVWILAEAWQRFLAPQDLLPAPALIVAVIGLAVNLIAYRWLGHGGDNINVQAAALHVLGDILGSLAAIASALVVYFTGWLQADSLLAVVVASILARGAWRILGTSGRILMEGAPPGLDQQTMREALVELPGVSDVHQVHVWGLTPERPLVTLHARVDAAADQQAVHGRLKAALRETFGVSHSVIQLEHGVCPDEAAGA